MVTHCSNLISCPGIVKMFLLNNALLIQISKVFEIASIRSKTTRKYYKKLHFTVNYVYCLQFITISLYCLHTWVRAGKRMNYLLKVIHLCVIVFVLYV